MARENQRGAGGRTGRNEDNKRRDRNPGGGHERRDPVQKREPGDLPRREPHEKGELRLPGREKETGGATEKEERAAGPRDEHREHALEKQGRRELEPQRQGEREAGAVDVERELEEVGRER